jgi:hypothetical protein
MISVAKIVIKKVKNFRKKKVYVDDYETLLDDQLFDLFLKFAEKEWAQENLLAFRAIQKYKKCRFEKRVNLAFDIYYLYLNDTNSPLEINIDKKNCKEVFEEINNPTCKFPDNLFYNVEKVLKTNISDTWSRFVCGHDYAIYIRNHQFQLSQMTLI